MTYQIILHPRARLEFLQLRDSIAEVGGVAASRRILQAFETVLAGLRDVPHKSSLRDDLAPGLRSIPAAGKGVVSFVVDDAAQMVTVVAITYAGQNWMGRLRERS
jgi:toxin ParE1/3/4